MSQPPNIPAATEEALDVRRRALTGPDAPPPAAALADCAVRLATAIRLRNDAEAGYRQFRANVGIQLREADPKLAEWKVKEAIDATPHFATWKDALGNGEAWVAFFAATADALRIAGGLGRGA